MSMTSMHPWFKHYSEGVPEKINPDRYASLVEMYDEVMQRCADNIAFSNYGVSISYAELNQKSEQFAAYCQQQLGLKHGDRVALMIPNLLQYPVAIFGLLRAGMVVVNVNPLYTASELQHQLQDAAVSAIVVLENYAHVVEKVLPKLQLRNVIVTKMGDLLGPVKGSLINAVVKYIKKIVPKYHIEGAVYFKQVLQLGASLSFQKVAVKSSDLAFLQYTGGTTGSPKGAMLSHRNMVANVLQCVAWVSPVTSPGKDYVLAALPLYHIFSLTVCCFGFLSQGSHCVLVTDPRDSKRFIALLKKVPITVFVGINTLFNNLLHHQALSSIDFSHLKLTVAGGMAVQEVVSDKWQKVTGSIILQGYGLTETSPVVCINPVTEAVFNGSIGLPVSSTDVVILDDEGRVVPASEPGELCIKGPQVMSGYWRQPDETANVFNKDGWLRTGDIATIDEDGFVRIVDRKKDMILVSGFNVYPNEIEAVIAMIPGINEVCVVGVADSKAGERVKAFIVRDQDDLTEENIISYCRQHLTNYKIPKYIEFRDQLPKSNVGKILRKMLREN
jgi:long-chain acyl-CoA synthetase